MAQNERNFVQQFIGVTKAIPTGKKISFAVTILLVVGGFAALLYWANRPDFQVLFANLDTADAARITEKLQEKRVPFQLKEGGNAILVPDDTVYNLRLELAGEGLPRGQNVGFEIFDEISFGTTEFVQKLKYQQALQGELARTIMGFDAVTRARVHIVSSGDSLFAEPEKASTASVVLRLHPGRILDQRQLQGIINLVARAVRGLRPENVTVVDMAGGLLSRGHEGDEAGMSSKAQFEHQQKLERALENRVQTMLEPIVGLNKVVARVSAELDFEKVNVLEERYDPDNVVVRSEQRQKELSSGSRGRPSGSPDLQSQVYRSEGGAGGSTKDFQRENAVINYEINKVNRQSTNSVGDIKRLSAAVIIDGPYAAEEGTAGNGGQKFVPRSRREMKTFEDIIKKAIGFDEARGDQVNVSNIPFAMQEEVAPLYDKPATWMDYAKKAAKPSFNVLLVVLFFLLAIRPFKKWLDKNGEMLASRPLVQGEGVPRLTNQAGQGRAELDNMERFLEAGHRNPDLAAQVIRNWISEGK